MSLCLLNTFQCEFGDCKLMYGSHYDLIAHIELVHIPAIEEEQQRRNEMPQGEESVPRANSGANLPLSYVQRFFVSRPYTPTPIDPTPQVLPFNHYRKRALPLDEHDSLAEDLEECGPNDTEMRFRCQVLDCGKRYKNSIGLRNHMRLSHTTQQLQQHDERPSTPSTSMSLEQTAAAASSSSGNVIGNDAVGGGALAGSVGGGGSSTPLHSSVVNNGVAMPPTTPSPAKGIQTRPHKCTHCTKRYKTIQGLQNHIATHKAGSEASSDRRRSSPSPAVMEHLLTHVRSEQAQQALQQQQQQMDEQRTRVGSGGRVVPVLVAPPNSQVTSSGRSPMHFVGSQSQTQQGVPTSAQPPLPVRSLIPTQQGQLGGVYSRYSQQQQQQAQTLPHMQPTGQVLQSQYQQQQQQRRAQLAAQQAAQQAQQAAASSSQSPKTSSGGELAYTRVVTTMADPMPQQQHQQQMQFQHSYEPR